MRKTSDPHMRRYEIGQEKRDALAALDRVLGEAREERIHALLQLPEPIRKNDMTVSANNRLMTVAALKRWLESTAEAEKSLEVSQEAEQRIELTRSLVERIVGAIERVNLVIAAEEMDPENGDSPAPPKAMTG